MLPFMMDMFSCSLLLAMLCLNRLTKIFECIGTPPYPYMYKPPGLVVASIWYCKPNVAVKLRMGVADPKTRRHSKMAGKWSFLIRPPVLWPD